MKTNNNSKFKSIQVIWHKINYYPLYIIEYTSGKKRYIYSVDEISYEFNQRINNFIDTGKLASFDYGLNNGKYFWTKRTYTNGMQNVID